MATSSTLDWSVLDKAVEEIKRAGAAALESKKRKLEERIAQERQTLENERKQFKEECEFMYRQYGVEGEEASSAASAQISTFPASVKINVGGRIFDTTMTTLRGVHTGEEGSMLAAMFSDRHPNCKDADGIVFIDRNGDRFAHLLDYLVTGEVGYFRNLRASQRQAQHELSSGSSEFMARGLEFEQMLAEAQYFQLRGVIDVLQPCLSGLPNPACYGSFHSDSNTEGIPGWKWQHREHSDVERYTLQDDGTITVKEEGSYLIMSRVPGVSSNNSGYVQLLLDDVSVGEAWSGNANGFHNMLHFEEVLRIPAGGRLKLQGVKLSHSYNMGRALATSFTIAPLLIQSKYTPFVSLRALDNSSGTADWQWKHKAGSKDLVNINSNDTATVTFGAAGTYLIMTRVPGVSSNNDGCVQLMVDSTVVGESWAGDANGYHKMLHVNEVLQINSGGQLKLHKQNLTHSFNMGRPLAANLIALRLGGLADMQEDGFAKVPIVADIPFHKYASFSSSVCGGSGVCWTWTCTKGCSEIVALAEGGRAITIIEAGTYLIMARVPGAGTGNNAFAELLLGDTVVGESWGNDANGYLKMLQFSEILKIGPRGRLQVRNANLTHNFNHKSASLTILRIDAA